MHSERHSATKPASSGVTTMIRILRQGINLLSADFAELSIAERAGCAPLLRHGKQQLAVLEEERPNLVRVLLLGEFKAGKSTLINSLLGRTVAATDVFEMTSAICRIIPRPQQPERVTVTSNDVTLPEQEMSLENFIAATRALAEARRRGDQTQFGNYKQVRLYLDTSFAAELIDTPGLGASIENELTALNAVATSDVILWTMDVESLGGAREAAVLDRMRLTGQPVLVAVTKADLTDDEEMESIVDFVAKTYHIPEASIYPVSAEQELQTKNDPGITRLKSALLNLAPGRAYYRDQALQAQATDIAAELAEGIELVRTGLETALTDAKQNCQSMLDMAEVVTKDICSKTGTILRDKMRDEIEAILVGKIGPKRARLTQEDFVSAINHSIEGAHSKEFWDSLRTQVTSQFQNEWSEGIKAQLSLLNRSIDDARQDVKEVGVQFSESLYAEKSRRLQRQQTAVTMAVEGGLAAVAMAVLHFPVVIVAVAAAPGIWAMYNNKAATQAEPSMEEIEYHIRIAVNEWLDAFIAERMQDFYPSMLKQNLSVARAASENYSLKSEDWPATMAEVESRLRECEVVAAALAQMGDTVQQLLPSF